MGLETGDRIEDLDVQWPSGTDNVSQGDDHLRLIKRCMQGSFPNLGSGQVTKTAEELNQSGTPTGGMSMYGGTTAPSGFLLCDGSEQSRETYADLYNVIGISFGSGNGSTTFNLPDMRQRVPAGAGSNAVGVEKGKDFHTASDMPRHTHTMGAGGAHAHRLKTSSFQNTSGNDRVVDKDNDSADLVTSQVDGAHQHVINNTGSSATSDNRQATLYVSYLIKI